MTLTRWEPMRDMVSLGQAMDRLFQHSVLTGNGEAVAGPPLDVIEGESEIEVRATVPGFEADQIDVAVKGDVLTIQGQHAESEERTNGNYFIRERRVGSFHRAIRLPAPVKADTAKAEYKNGELRLTIAKHEQAVAQKIPVKH